MRSLLLFLALCPLFAAPGNRIFFESFETPTVVDPLEIRDGETVGAFTYHPSSNSPMTLLNRPGYPGSDGAQVLSMGMLWDGGDAAIGTMLSGLVIGQEYRVSVDYSLMAWPAHDYGDWTLSIRTWEPGADEPHILAGVSGYVPRPDGLMLWGTEGNPWRALEGSFVATGPEIELVITGFADLAYPVIDNVQVIAVPEPRTAILLIAAATFAMLRRGSSRFLR